MKRYIFMRLMVFIPILLGVTVFCFVLLNLIPGNVVEIMYGQDSISAEMEMKLMAELNLDKPVWQRYMIWLSRMVRGDFGTSYATGTPVMGQILHRLPLNIELLIMASLFMIILGIPGGAIAAAFDNTKYDYAIRFFSILGYCVPHFWLATLIVLVSSLYFPWLQVLNYVPFREDPWSNITGLLIPGFVIGTGSLAYVVRITRSSFLENMRQDYVRTARAKGFPEKLVFFRHITKNSLIPVVTVLGMQIGYLIGGFVLTEEVFVLPGVGRLLLGAILKRDFPIVTGIIMVIATSVVIMNLVVDVIYGFLDPRIKY